MQTDAEARMRPIVTFANIMVNLDVWHSNDACLRIAGDLAEKFHAKLIGIAASALELPYYGNDPSAESPVKWQHSEIRNRLADVEKRFRYAEMQRTPEIEWRSATTARPVDYVAREARAADLIVTSANDEGLLANAHERLNPGDLVMQTGRPVLVVPPKAEPLKLDCGMVAWKDTREARRAVKDALSLLQKTRDVVVIEVIEDEANRSAAHARIDDVIAWLKRHNIVAFGRVFHFPREEKPLEKLWQYGADFLVAGAYGHMRLREWVFGGFTHDLLKSSPRCVFLTH